MSESLEQQLRQIGQQPTRSKRTPFIGTKTSRFMKPAALRNFFLLSVLRKVERYFQAVFRFTEADAGCILAAYGLHSFEVDRLQNSRSHEEEARQAHLGRVSLSKRMTEPPAPIPLGIHPDFICGNWRPPQSEVSSKSIQLRGPKPR
jgi:hypothetical protein